MSIRKILFLAVAGFIISPALMAADIDGPSDERIFSDEFLGTHTGTGTIAGGVLAVTLAAEYTLGDIVTVDYSGGALVGSSVPTTAGTLVNVVLDGVVLGLLSADTDQVTYRVTAIVPCTGVGCANSTNGALVQFAAADIIDLDALDAQAAGGVTVSYSAATDTGIPLDTGGGDLRDVAYIQVEDEYSIKVTLKFDAIVEVADERTTFEGTDQFDISTLTVPVEPTIGAGFGTVLVDVDIVWSGNFGWIIDDDLTTADVQPITGVVTVTGTGCTSVVVTAVTISATCAGTGAIDLKLDPSKNLDAAALLAVLPGTSFSVAVTVNYTGASTDLRLFSASAGSWTLNGFQAFLPYMPYGSSITQVIYLVNRGSQSGALTVDWIDQNGNSASLGTVATLGPSTTMSIGPIIEAALPTAQRTSGRLGLTITANVPATDVQINSQYNVSGNRAFVLHEDNRP